MGFIRAQQTYLGTIISKELEYDGSNNIIPVLSVAQGKQGKLHVTVRNNMSTPQYVGIYWFINDPNGLIAEEYTDWKGWPFPTRLNPSDTHEFQGGYFYFTKLGNYGTWIDMLMGSSDSPVVVMSQRYIGRLCTVVSTQEYGFSEMAVSSFGKV